MKKPDATLQEWKALYQAAAEFRKIEPWEWVRETDIFGVRNPSNGEIGYCCIMGEMGEVLAMAVYLGTNGLQGYIDIHKGLIKPEDPDSMFVQNCLMVSFENKSFLEKEDKTLIQKLGLKFSGPKPWPLFRRYEPGYFPWFLRRDEVLQLTIALRQARDVCLRLEENPGLLIPPKKDLYFVRVAAMIGESVGWEDAWLKPAETARTAETNEPVDEIRIQKIKKKTKASGAAWEVDFFYAPTPIAETGRPYFPRAIMTADHESGFIYDMQLAQDADKEDFFIKCLLSCIENTFLPGELLVRREEAAKLFEPYAVRLGIKLRRVKKLPSIDNARREMVKHFRRL